MTISSIGASTYSSQIFTNKTNNSSAASQNNQNAIQDIASSDDTSSGTNAAQTFMNYMKETPGQRMIDAWLTAHHLTEKDLEAMPPDKQKAIKDQMAADIKKQTEQKAQQNLVKGTNILV